MSKKYYIKSKFRFTVFITITILIICLGINGIFSLSKAYADGKGAVMETYRAITVESGDTLWSIALEYMDNRNDIREFIYEIKNINELDTSEISVGQKLLIPV